MSFDTSRPNEADKPQSLRKPDERFQPKWPRSVSGKNWRTPSRIPSREAFSKRADKLYRFAPLADADRELLLRAHSDLDSKSSFLFFRNSTESRICAWVRSKPPSQIGDGGRAVRTILDLERKYFGRARSEPQPSDI
jgi:hypothetical protein